MIPDPDDRVGLLLVAGTLIAMALSMMLAAHYDREAQSAPAAVAGGSP